MSRIYHTRSIKDCDFYLWTVKYGHFYYITLNSSWQTDFKQFNQWRKLPLIKNRSKYRQTPIITRLIKKKNLNPFKFLFLLLPIVLCLIRRKPIELIFAQNYRKYITLSRNFARLFSEITMLYVVLCLLLKVPFKFEVYSRNNALVAKASRYFATIWNLFFTCGNQLNIY